MQVEVGHADAGQGASGIFVVEPSQDMHQYDRFEAGREVQEWERTSPAFSAYTMLSFDPDT